MLVINICSNVLVVIGLGLLGAWVGLWMCTIALGRDTASNLFYVTRPAEKRNKILPVDWVMITIWISLMFIATWITQEGFWTWFAFFGSVAFAIGIWQKNHLVYRFLGMFASFARIIYNYAVTNFFGVILESALFASIIAGTVHFLLVHNKRAAV
jgi:hypothetical protein